ncbi:AAA family ATPase [Nocardia sp. NPDC023852]|uniref:ATP-binding protein n=1 Tax=Nocardia sp. NPDC023852 TaxID=3154697 RepID=UPI0033DE4332
MTQLAPEVESTADAGGFIGRDRELDTVFTLLPGQARLITLVGAGGIGKTRLAAEVARRYHRARRVPVRWARLARLARGCDRSAIEETIAHAVVDFNCPERSSWYAIVDALTRSDSTGRVWPTVLVLDNCEHVLDAVAEVITDLLDAAPGLTVLATSREAIGWADEYLVNVPPLQHREAAALFLERAEAAGRRLTDAGDIATAQSICRHLHNNPLFIKLAAARLLRRPIAVLLQELNGTDDDQRLRWSHGTRMGDGPRHRGIGDAITWSYDLCPDDERLLFERMSVFAPGCPVTSDDDANHATRDVGIDLEAIQAVCADPGRLAPHRIQDILDRLANRSLVSVHFTRTTARYSLLESLQVFARQQHEERTRHTPDESTLVAERHLSYYRDKVVDTATHWFGPREQELMSWIRASWENVLTALRTSVEDPARSGLGLQICVGLLALPVPFISSFRDVRLWTERMLAATDAVMDRPTESRLTAMALLVVVLLRQGAQDDAERMLENCVAASSVEPDNKRHWRDTMETDIGLPAAVELAWGLELWLVGYDVRAVTVLTRAAAKAGHNGDRGLSAYCEMSAAGAAAMLGANSADHLTESFLDHATTAGSPWATAWAGLTRAVIHMRRGDDSPALDLVRDSLAYYVSTDEWGSMWAVQLRIVALAATVTDDADRHTLAGVATEIAYLAGGLGTLRARYGSNIQTPPEFTERTAEAIARARDLLGADAFTSAQERGAQLRPELDEVQQLALGRLRIPRPEPPTAKPVESRRRSPWSELTQAEQDVAILAAAGWTNAAIAERRGTSLRTVEAQLAAILHKLALGSRREIAELVPESRTAAVRNEAARWASRREAPKS